MSGLRSVNRPRDAAVRFRLLQRTLSWDLPSSRRSGKYPVIYR